MGKYAAYKSRTEREVIVEAENALKHYHRLKLELLLHCSVCEVSATAINNTGLMLTANKLHRNIISKRSSRNRGDLQVKSFMIGAVAYTNETESTMLSAVSGEHTSSSYTEPRSYSQSLI